jgi:hypothetical protein
MIESINLFDRGLVLGMEIISLHGIAIGAGAGKKL